jgi:hypothetical protein
LPAAKFAAAPPEIAKVIAPEEILPPIPPARRKLSGFSGGQILPAPTEANSSDYPRRAGIGGFAAGAMAALLFLIAVYPQAFTKAIIGFETAGQASLAGLANLNSAERQKTKARQNNLEIYGNKALEDLVCVITSWFDSFR